MDEELQGRAVAIALQCPRVLDGSLEDCWDELWLRLGEELGWQAIAQADPDALRDEIRIAVESERLRRAGWSPEQLKEWEAEERYQFWAARSRSRPGEAFDVSVWVGPLLEEGARERLKNVEREWRREETGGRHPASYVSLGDFEQRWIEQVGGWGLGRLGGWGWPPSAEQLEARLTALGAPATCRVLWAAPPSGFR